MESGPSFAPVAIVGYGCVFPPDSYDATGYWRNLIAGTSGIGEPDADRWDWALYHDPDRDAVDRTYCRLGGFIRDYTFPSSHGFDPGTVADLTRTQQLVLDSASQALAMADLGSGLGDRRAGLFVGNMLGDEALLSQSLRTRAIELTERLGRVPELAALDQSTREAVLSEFTSAVEARTRAADFGPEGLLPAGIAARVAELLGVQGPAVLADGACASGLMIIDVAARYLADRSLDIVLASGVMANMAVTGNVCFAKIGGLSETGSHPLDADADGLVPGEGVGTVVLKRLDDALSDGDDICGVIRGIATRCDGKGKAIYAPSSRGQEAAMQRALDVAGLEAHQIDHLETHATSTPTGDLVELESVDAVYGGEGRRTPLSIGSGKALIGHTFPAAGMANLIKVLLAFEHATQPPVHGVNRAQPLLEDRRYALHKAPVAWPERESTRRAVANAFGFGGVNTSICLEDRPSTVELSRAVAGPPPSPPALAVLGIGAVLPGVTTFADLGPETTFPASESLSRWGGVAAPENSSNGTPQGAPIADWEFPWRRFRVPPATLADIDRAQQFALVAADEALQQAFPDNPAAWREAGVFIGASAGLETSFTRNLRVRGVEFGAALSSIGAAVELDETTLRVLHEEIVRTTSAGVAATNENALPGYMDSIIGGRIGNMLDLRGTNMVIDDGAASVVTALEVASRHLAQDDCPVALVGGVHANLLPDYVEPFARLLAESGTDVSSLRPAEGAAMFVVCPLDRVPEGATPLAVLDPVGAPAEPGAVTLQVPFFFGAQGAVDIARAVAGLTTAPSSTVTVGAVKVHPPEADPGPETDEAAVPFPATTAAPERAPTTGSEIWFRSAGTLADLRSEVERALAGAPQIPSPDGGGEEVADLFRIAMTYRSAEELERKLRLVAGQLGG